MDKAARIRELAFEMWQQAGCPPDKAEEFWLIAEQAERDGPQPAETDQDVDPAKFAGF